MLDAQPRLDILLGDYRDPGRRPSRVAAQCLQCERQRNPITAALLAQTIELLQRRARRGGRRVLAELAVARRGEVVAHVSAAAELSDAQRTRLTELLSRIYGHPVSVQLHDRPRAAGWSARSPSADEVIDGTLVIAAGRGQDPVARLTTDHTNPSEPKPSKVGRRKAMAELTISADDIQGAIEEYVASFTADTAREEIGTVIDAGDGIAHVEGLPSVMTQELLEFPGGVLGVALNLDEHSVGAVILGDFEKIEEGQQVKRTGEVLSVPVGDAFLGRVVNPLGQPIDGRGDIETDDPPRAGDCRPRRWCSARA